MKIFLTGATGFIGRHVLGRLLHDGYVVIASSRSPESALKLRAAGAELFERSLLDESAVRAAMQGCSAVVHCAAHLRTWGSWAEFEASNVVLTRAMLRGALASGVEHFVQLSAASVVMQGPGPMLGVDESAATTRRPDLPYCSTKAMAEAMVLQAAGPGLRTLALRPPLVWGAGDTVDGELGKHIARGRFGWFSGGRYPYATCHVDNLCEAVSLALQSQLSGEALFVTDGDPVELRDFLGRRIQASGLPVPHLSIPADAAWALAGLVEGAWRRLGLATEPPVTREAVRLLGFPFTLDNRRSHRQLGYRPVITADQGLRQLSSRAANGLLPSETVH
jgi:nucleoside-diphosphate-sugar epimerase